jgi:hypothetical protein
VLLQAWKIDHADARSHFAKALRDGLGVSSPGLVVVG